MIPTRAQVITYAQFLLGDPSGQKFVDTGATSVQVGIAPAFESAFRELYSTFDLNQIPRAENTVWVNLPAFTTQLSPAQAGIADFGEIVNLEERDIGTSVAITAATTATPIQITTAAPHNVSAGTEILISGVLGQVGANGRWFPTIVDPSNLTLNGSVSVAAYTSGGTLTTSSAGYTPVWEVNELPTGTTPPALYKYVWQNDIFLFVGATLARELKITYFASGTAPVSGSCGVDDSLEFLAFRTAALAGGIVDMARASQLAGDANVYLDKLVQPQVRAMQRNPIRPRAYRAGRFASRPYTPVVIP